jgi:hypothetical protein
LFSNGKTEEFQSYNFGEYKNRKLLCRLVRRF